MKHTTTTLTFALAALALIAPAFAQETPQKPAPPAAAPSAPTPLTDARKYAIMKREWRKLSIEAEMNALREKTREQLDAALEARRKEWQAIAQEQAAELKALVPEGYELTGDLEFTVAQPKRPAPQQPQAPRPIPPTTTTKK